jgi:formyltetrahydrofolate hydrolase
LKNSAILLVQCPDRKGLNATIAEFIYRYDGNVLHFEQHQAGEERYIARGWPSSFPDRITAWWTCCIASVAENWNAIFR